jgi:hypothetical protein
MKTPQSYSIEDSIVEQLNTIAFLKKMQKSEIVESLIRDYVIKNKAEVNEIMLNFWKDKIDVETYTCIKPIKFKKTSFTFDENVIIVSKNDDYYLISDVNRTKGLSVKVDEFNQYFKNN